LLSTFPQVVLTDELAARFLNGQRLALGRETVVLPEQQGRVRVYHDGKLLGTAILQEYGVLAPERLIARPQE
jgi:tRNA pseudouridine55 synthase